VAVAELFLLPPRSVKQKTTRQGQKKKRKEEKQEKKGNAERQRERERERERESTWQSALWVVVLERLCPPRRVVVVGCCLQSRGVLVCGGSTR
jgi:hypothetical protein